jgi:hypothetical protein
MPRKELDYSNNVIYKIVCDDLNVKDTYVGHTTNFTQRKRLHKDACNIETSRGYNYRLYQHIRANGGWENWSMIEIEKYPCNDKQEACARERYHYELLGANMNVKYPARTSKEYRDVNKNNKKEYDINYRMKNKDKICEHIQCECGGKYLLKHRSQHFQTSKHKNWELTI